MKITLEDDQRAALARLIQQRHRLPSTLLKMGEVIELQSATSTKENVMPFEKFDLENLDKERRKAVANSIRTMSVEELKALGNEIFRYADDPWREAFFRFIAENPGATFHHAVMTDGVNIVYCRDQDKGMWFLPGSGMGPLQATGRRMMSEIIRGQR